MFNETYNIKINTKKEIVSLGNWCLTGMILKDANLKHCSYPFDWMCSHIKNIIHTIEDDFKEFLNKNNYSLNKKNRTRNNFYFNTTRKLFGKKIKDVDHQHHNLCGKDYDYITRCVDRFKNLNKYEEVTFVMIQPLYLIKKIEHEDENDLCEKLYEILTSKFKNKVKLLVFNIKKYNNNIFREDILSSNLIVYELDSNIIKGKYGMDSYDNKGVKKFLEIINNH